MFKLQSFKLPNIDKNLVLIIIAVLGILVTGALILNDGRTTPKAVVERSMEYINKNILQGGQTASLVSFKQESGLIKVTMKIADKEYDSYITNDGKLFFPEALSLTDTATAVSNNENTPPAKATPATLAKTDKPLLEAYIVSRCPFGIQMQRVIDNAIANAPDLANYVKVRYMGSVVNGKITAMHGDQEAQENLRQICLREEQPAKYWPYVSCYIREGNATSCQETQNVDVAKMNACTSDPNRGLAYAQKDFDLNTKYSIQGSPTLIVNGQKVSEFDFGGRASDAIKTIVCDSANSPFGFCSKKLNTEQAATAFSLTYAGEGSSANNSANCAL